MGTRYLWATKRIVAVITRSVVVAPMLCSAARAQLATQVVTFRPAIPDSRPIRGSCSTGSIATDRPGAWRCTAEDMIYDPCFSVLSAPLVVVCEADPFGKRGVALQLAKPLPAATKTRCKDCVWALELADGSTCTVAGTGTLAMVAGQPLRWGCPNHDLFQQWLSRDWHLGRSQTWQGMDCAEGYDSLVGRLIHVARQKVRRSAKSLEVVLNQDSSAEGRLRSP